MIYSWQTLINQEKEKGYLIEIKNKIAEYRSSGKIIYPYDDLIFKALHLCPLREVKVVMLGYTPYSTEGTCDGLAYSTQQKRTPPMLANIMKEIHTDYFPETIGSKLYPFETNDLSQWANQGVLLLNSVLTTERENPLSHVNLGWQQFTIEIIKTINKLNKPIVYMFWGEHFSEHEKYVGKKALILKTSCPHPLTVNNGFYGCKHFTKANTFLKKHYGIGINWSLLQFNEASNKI